MKESHVVDNIVITFNPEFVKQRLEDILSSNDIKEIYQALPYNERLIVELVLKAGYWQAIEDVKNEIQEQGEFDTQGNLRMIIHGMYSRVMRIEKRVEEIANFLDK